MPKTGKSEAKSATSAAPTKSAESPSSSLREGRATLQEVIGRSFAIKGDLAATEPLTIEGNIEGAVNLAGHRLTVGKSGVVKGDIVAREIVVMGKVIGSCTASDRVEIRNAGSLMGDVITPRISIDEGAYFKGGVEILKSRETNPRVGFSEGSAHAAFYRERAEESLAPGRYCTLENESDREGALSKWKSA